LDDPIKRKIGTGIVQNFHVPFSPLAAYGLSHTHLMRCLHRVPSEAMMSLKSGVLGTHGHARGPRATGHVAAPDPSRTRSRVWSHKTCDDTGALLGGGPDTSVTWRRQSLTAQGAGLKPRGTWRLRSPLLPGDGLGASGHVATPKPFLTGGALGASGHVATPEPFPGG
jgi:hypothetical protein